MAIKYYPSFRIIPNQNTTGTDFLLNGKPYSGKYYVTYDGKSFTGPNNIEGPNEPLTPILSTGQTTSVSLSTVNATKNTVSSKPSLDYPVSYYPYPIQEDYDRGYIIRYFTKKVNNAGYVTEISPSEYSNIQNGTANYDVSMYQTGQIMWKLTGPLNSVRISQYDTRAGIIDTNKRLTETLNKTFLGITDFIGGKYDKYSKPTT
jgi:hypothetical protein